MTNRLIPRSAALAIVLAAGVSPIGFLPARAQECFDCRIPSGYTTVKQAGEICINKSVSCTCAQPGGTKVKSTQPMCLYLAKRGGGGGGIPSPVRTPDPQR